MAVLAIMVAGGAAAAAPDDAATIARVEAYLNNIRTLSARFVQIADDGGMAQGRFYLARPGRLRFEYDPPVPILIVAEGGWLVYYDSELEEVTYVPTRKTPARLLLGERVTLSGKVTVIDIRHDPGALSLTIRDQEMEEEASLTLVFSDRPLALRQWRVTDAQGRTTRLAFQDMRLNIPLDDKLFKFVDPEFRDGDIN